VKDNGFPWPPPGLLGIFFTSVTVCAKKRKKSKKEITSTNAELGNLGGKECPSGPSTSWPGTSRGP
jgi:hypothetical protein